MDIFLRDKSFMKGCGNILFYIINVHIEFFKYYFYELTIFIKLLTFVKKTFTKQIWTTFRATLYDDIQMELMTHFSTACKIVFCFVNFNLLQDWDVFFNKIRFICLTTATTKSKAFARRTSKTIHVTTWLDKTF